jgi:hypothetical protein
MAFWDFLDKKKKASAFIFVNCGETHEEIPAFGFTSPICYEGLTKEEQEEIAELSTDFCVITYPDQTDRFIRTTLTIPINDACDDLDYGIWVSLSEKSFNEYKSEFKDNKEGRVYFGMISNEISDYGESVLGLHVNVNTRSGGSRPEISVHRIEHQLILDLENGISLAEAESRIERMKKSLKTE